MKVYVLIANDNDVCGVYSTQERAEREASNYEAEDPGQKWLIREFTLDAEI